MVSVLVAYGSGEGQTTKVAEHVGSVLSERGHDVEVIDVATASGVDVDGFDAVLVGSSVNNRRHRPEAYAFVERHREALSTRPSAFFQLSLASIVPLRWAREGARDFVDAFVEETGWRPDRVGLFAGAVKYTQYDRRTRFLFRLVSMVTTGDTDTSRDYEYTDWDEVERFAVEFAEFVEAERDRAPPSAGSLDGVAPARSWGRSVALAAVGLGLAGAAYWVAMRRKGARTRGRRNPTEGQEPRIRATSGVDGRGRDGRGPGPPSRR